MPFVPPEIGFLGAPWPPGWLGVVQPVLDKPVHQLLSLCVKEKCSLAPFVSSEHRSTHIFGEKTILAIQIRLRVRQIASSYVQNASEVNRPT